MRPRSDRRARERHRDLLGRLVVGRPQAQRSEPASRKQVLGVDPALPRSTQTDREGQLRRVQPRTHPHVSPDRVRMLAQPTRVHRVNPCDHHYSAGSGWLAGCESLLACCWAQRCCSLTVESRLLQAEHSACTEPCWSEGERASWGVVHGEERVHCGWGLEPEGVFEGSGRALGWLAMVGPAGS